MRLINVLARLSLLTWALVLGLAPIASGDEQIPSSLTDPIAPKAKSWGASHLRNE
jgi:hypothetical protein